MQVGVEGLKDEVRDQSFLLFKASLMGIGSGGAKEGEPRSSIRNFRKARKNVDLPEENTLVDICATFLEGFEETKRSNTNIFFQEPTIIVII